MMYHVYSNPPQWLLDGLLEDEKKRIRKQCPDCGVEINQPHTEGCDVARCLTCKGQALSCDCENHGKDIWTGLWPGILDAYKYGFVCFDTSRECLAFDLNRTAEKNITGG